jgi:aspartyl-tRNA(Asn)/glutamyl-tRNA(Gln) amidotransferase subunit B
MNKYETVIGLEVHVQLATKTKIFCGCSTEFGAPPNTHVCPVCLGMPGVLPVFNRISLEYAIKIALSLGCEIQGRMKFDRKNYYYPDLPKNYQISQFDMPLAFNGKVEISGNGRDKKTIGITRAHMEEDAGKLIHGQNEPYSYVDLNRTGTPLLEIVSEPDIRSPQEAYEYLVNLKKIIKYLEVSDCNMEEGSLRCDANISLREYGQSELGEKVEIKNLNSFKAVRDSLLYEEERQKDLLDDGELIKMETRLWDEERSITSSMRMKEGSHDYRYFPEPDLVPFEIHKDLINKISDTMPELPAAKTERFRTQYGFEDDDLEVLTGERELADFFEKIVENGGTPREACNWVKGELLMHMKDRSTTILGLNITPDKVARIIGLLKNGAISNLAAKEVLAACIENGTDPETIIKEKGLEQVSDENELETIVNQVIKDNEKSVNDFKNGKENAISFLVGQVMKRSKGKANPKLVNDMFRKMI